MSNNGLLVQQQGVSEGSSKNVERCASYLNYRGLIDDRNNRYEGGKMKRLHSQRGKERAQGELCYTGHGVKYKVQSVARGVQSARQVGWRRQNLLRFSEGGF